MLRSQSDFSARNHSIDQSFRPFEPTKRENRPFYVPEVANDMERVFSEYDWKNHRFTSTLGPIPQTRPTPASASTFPPYNRNSTSNSTVVTKKEEKRKTSDDQVSMSRSSFLPTHISRHAVDESITSSYLLSSASSPSSSFTATSGWECPSPCYTSSQISQTDAESPLQQSIMANADLDCQFRLPSSRPQTHNTSYKTRRVTIDEESSGRSKHKETTTAGRTRSSTWSSDITAVSRSDDYTTEKKGKAPAFVCESAGVSNSPRMWPTRPSSEIWRSPVRRRRSLMRSQSAFARLDHFDQAQESGFPFEEEEEEPAEENSESQHRENRLSSIFSAIHYQYVSVGLRIQLAVHRTEKKVSRRLSNKRKSRHSDFL